eukprot:COSAG02_NODE_2320_length_9141_cov_5.148087_5_plen_62_part_00
MPLPAYRRGCVLLDDLRAGMESPACLPAHCALALLSADSKALIRILLIAPRPALGLRFDSV